MSSMLGLDRYGARRFTESSINYFFRTRTTDDLQNRITDTSNNTQQHTLTRPPRNFNHDNSKRAVRSHAAPRYSSTGTGSAERNTNQYIRGNVSRRQASQRLRTGSSPFWGFVSGNRTILDTSGWNYSCLEPAPARTDANTNCNQDPKIAAISTIHWLLH